MPPTYRLLLPVPQAGFYDYLPPEGESLSEGQYVEVPFGGRVMIGIVWGAGGGDVPVTKLKAVRRVLDVPPLPPVSRAFVEWVSAYTLAPEGVVLKMLFGNAKLIEAKKKDSFDCPRFDPDFHQPTLTDAQRAAADYLTQKVTEGDYSATLLDGVTGSGKTEVFCEAMAENLRQNKQTLLLLPEIAMTAALIDRLTARFGGRPVEWHSGLGERQRRFHWQAIARGEAKLILGARSALFLPYPDLGLIVVDEEHEAAYKQEEGTIYHGRDMAVARAHLGRIPVILSSATPSLETLFNGQQGKYGHVKLPTRFGSAGMPSIACVDVRKQKFAPHEFIAPPVFDALKETIARGKQAMLFLNRRGYAPLTLCRGCGHRLECPRCTAWLTEHKKAAQLRCHHCDFAMRLPESCPSCQAKDKFAACGPGVERIAEEVSKRLPEVRFALMVSDLLETPQAAQELVDRMARRELDLLIGTQIMAKGYHFPDLTFVGVIDGDLGLSGGDPRAAERTFQLLQQMAGRSGRGTEAGRVLLQTTQPDHPVMQALVKGDRDAFLEAELREREAYHLPPYARLASLTVSGEDVTEVIKAAQHLAATAPSHPHVRILGPAPAPYARLRGKYRHRLMIQTPRGFNLSFYLRGWLSGLKWPHRLRLLVDIDPYSFL